MMMMIKNDLMIFMISLFIIASLLFSIKKRTLFSRLSLRRVDDYLEC
jgi:hypothetical protein